MNILIFRLPHMYVYTCIVNTKEYTHIYILCKGLHNNTMFSMHTYSSTESN